MSQSPEIPPLVARALHKAFELGYVETTRTETGRLLAALAATRHGVIAECGTGCGVGAAWLRSGAPTETRVLTAELDEGLAKGATEAISGDGVDVVHAAFSTLADHGPFSLLFADQSVAMEARDHDIAHDVLEPGGIFVIDDLTPTSDWPPRTSHGVDEARVAWHHDDRFVVCEVSVAPHSAVMICVRR